MMMPIVLANFGNQAGAGGALSSAPDRAVMLGFLPFTVNLLCNKLETEPRGYPCETLCSYWPLS
jgi:hypothetical protein